MLLRRMDILWLLGKMFYRFLLHLFVTGHSLVMLFSLVIFCLDDLLTADSGVPKYFTGIVLMSVFPFKFINICFIHFSTLILGTYAFIFIIYSW
jgi:hypothetical protein